MFRKNEQAEDSTERPVSVHERRVVSLPLAVLVLLLSCASAFGVGYRSLTSRADRMDEHLESTDRGLIVLQKRVELIEEQRASNAVIQNDVAWIKRTLEEMRREARRTP